MSFLSGRISILDGLRALLIASVGAPLMAGASDLAVPAGVSTTNVAAFADAQLKNALAASRIPGAVLSVVENGRVVFSGGFGLADVANGRRASARETLFRVASISKIFTAAATLELAGEKRLNLHEDINDYLERIQFPLAFGRPVTLHDLLTHSAGLDFRRLDYGAHSSSDRLKLGDYLAEFQPRRIRPPGQFSSYDNYGFALAGYIVQRAVDEPYAKYMKTRWLDPLGMTNSTFAVGPKTQRGRLARGYQLHRGRLVPLGRDYVNITPAAGLCSTAADMARFLVALTDNKRPDGTRAFAPSVLGGLMQPQFVEQPDLPGRCYGFNQVYLSGRRVLEQLGSWPGFNSVLLVFPKAGVGLFLAYNRNDGAQLAESICRAFSKRIPNSVSRRTERARPLALDDSSLAKFDGLYLSMHFPQYGPYLGLPPGKWVQATADGEIRIDGMDYREINSDVFERSEPIGGGHGFASRRVAFRESGDGTIADLLTERGSYRRAAWYELPAVQRAMTIVDCVVLISALVLWAVRGSLRYLKSVTFGPTPAIEGRPVRNSRLAWIARFTAAVAGTLGLWTVIIRAAGVPPRGTFPYVYGLPPAVKELMYLLPVLITFSLAVAGLGIWLWRRRVGSFADRLHYSLVAVVLLLICLDLISRNLLVL